MEKTSLAKKPERADQKIQNLSKTISAIIVVIGAVTGLYSWVSSQFQRVVSAQIDSLASEIRESDKKQNQAITRLELMNLIQNDPTNKAAIEKMARYYFIMLDGDLYVTEKYSVWAEQYGGDISIIIGVD